MDPERSDDRPPIRALYVSGDQESAQRVQTLLAAVSDHIELTVAEKISTAQHVLATSAVDCVVVGPSLSDELKGELLDSVDNRYCPIIYVLDFDNQQQQIPTGELIDHVSILPIEHFAARLSVRIQTLVETARQKQRTKATFGQFEQMVDRATDGIYAVDSEWQIQYVNQTMADGLSATQSELIGQDLWEAFPSLVGSELEAVYRDAMSSATAVSGDSYVGPPFDSWIESHVFPDGNGLTVFWRRTAKQEQTQSLTRAKAILDNIHDAVFVIDETYEIQFANPTAARIAGHSNPAALEGRTLADLIEGLVADEAVDAFQTAVSEVRETPGDSESAVFSDADLQIDFETAFGTRHFDVRLKSCVKSPTETLVVARDITEQHETRDQLKAERDALRVLQEIMADTEATTATQLSRMLALGCDTLNLEVGLVSAVEETEYRVRAVHAPTTAIAVGDQFDLATTPCAEVLARNDVYSFVETAENSGHQLTPETNTFEPASYIGVPLSVNDERYGTLSFASVASPVQEFYEAERTFVKLLSELIGAELTREQDQQQLKETNTRLESLIEAAPSAIFEIDPEGTIVRWNRGAEEIFGWTADEVVGELVPSASNAEVETFMKHRDQALAGKRIYGEELTRQTKDGTELDILLSTAPIEGPDGTVSSIIVVIEDISAQKTHERQLRALQQTAQQLTVASSLDEIGEIAVAASDRVLELDMTGLWKYDRTQHALVPVAQCESSLETLGHAPAFAAGEGLAWEVFVSGDVRVYDDVTQHTARYNPDTAIRSEIIVPLGHYGILMTGSNQYKEFSDREVDLFRILGASVKAAMVRAEREATLREQNDRLTEFAHGVSHDLRSPLSVAEGFLEIAKEDPEPAHFERVERAHDRISQLLENLLTLAQRGTTVTEGDEIAVAEAAREAWTFVETDTATVHIGESLPIVMGDRSRVTQLFENLYGNAIEHGGEDVTITVGPLSVEQGFYVEDDGTGIPVDQREEVLKHGVSLGSGTGFGLAIVAAIVRAHGWDLQVTESASGGARFEFIVEAIPKN
ncbi:PAS domain S-box protein [Halogranum rubrum]|nr:PAS domain S-box protein [Halogranum rubrum]